MDQLEGMRGGNLRPQRRCAKGRATNRITPEMIEAGAQQLCSYEPGADRSDEFARWIYEAMEEARLQPVSARQRRRA